MFGMIGWLMVEFGWPRPPLLLGVVLGPILETNLGQAIASDGFLWLARPSVLLIFALMVASLMYSIARSRSRSDREALSPMQESIAPASSLWSLGLALSVAILFVFALWESRNWPVQSRMMPWVIGSAGLSLAITQIAKDLLGLRGTRLSVQHKMVTPATAGIWAVILAFFITIWLLGFLVAVPVTVSSIYVV